MKQVRAKKYLGQHFLTDESVAQDIVNSLERKDNVLELGAGMGVLTKYLKDRVENFRVVEIDRESVDYLASNYPDLATKVIEGDFMKMNFEDLFEKESFALIGNFPYNISNQILFRVLESRDKITEVVGMFQKEVAQRVVCTQGSKTYGILSVFLSLYYEREYLFTVPNTVFDPVPQVQSAVIRLKRNNVRNIGCNEKLFAEVVKTAFNQRRKMLRQSLKPLRMSLEGVPAGVLEKRPEQLSANEFIELTNCIYNV